MDAVAAPADLLACGGSGESSPGRGADWPPPPPPGPDADPDAVRLVEPSPSLLERCGVCKGWLRERQPRLLPCLHSVCKGCLHGAVNAGSSPQAEGLISCPVCRQQCNIKDIIENYFLRDTGEVDTSSNKKVSQVCTSCEDNAVSSSFCVECAEWLCDACVEAHQRVKFTKDHTMSKKNPGLTVDGRTNCERPIFCSIHRQETLKLFCETCDTLTCRDCQLLTHKDHRYQFLEEAIKNQKMTLENLVKKLTEKKTQLQVTTKQVRTRLRDVQDMQKKVQVEIKMAILQIMRELNKRGKTLIQRVERLAEEQQLKLEQQHLSMSKLYRQMDHVLKFASWAVSTDNSTALLLCKKLIFYQLQRGLQSKVNTEELKNDIITFLWDSAFWTKNAANFGNVVIEVPPTLSTHVPVQHPSMSSHCPQPVSQQHPIPQLQPVSQHQPNNRMIATQGNSWQSHAPMQSSHRLPPPSYQQTQLPPPRQLPPQQNTQQVLIRQPHSAPHWSPVSGHSRMQQAVQLVKPKTTMPSTNGRYLQQMQVQVVQQGNIVQMQQQQQQQLMNQVLLLPQMNGVQIRQPQGHTQGAVKQSIIGGQTLYQQMSVHQPTAISKLPSPTQRQQLSFGPSAAGSVQSPPSHHLSTSTGLSNVPVSRPSPPVQQALRSNTSTSRQLLTTATPQQVHSNNSATSQSTQVGANCHRSPTSSNRLGNSPVDQLKMLVQQATSYPRVILPHRDGPANAHDFAQKQYAYPGPSLMPQQVGRDDSLLYSLILTSDGALAWSDSGAEGFVKGHSTCHVPPAFSEPRRGVSFKLSNVSTTTEQEEQRNNIKELQEASESRCMPLQCTIKHAGDSSDSKVKPKLNRKVPYVRLERLQIDLSTDTELPTFKLLPGSGQDEFNLIIIEGNGLPINPTFTAPTLASTLTPPNSVSPASVTEIEFVFNERTEVASKRTHHALSPTPSPSEKSPGSIADLKASPLCSASEKGEEADEVVCVVCGKGGELPCCSRCLKVFHIGCHVPALLSVPSVEWTCSLCVDLATSEVESESSTTLADSRNEVKEGLAALDQKKCERLLLFLLSHKMSQALHNPSGSSQLKSQQLDLSSIRAKLDRASSPHYSSPDEFVLEARLMFKAFSKLSQEKKEVAESVLTLESFFEEKLADVFSGKAFSSTPVDQRAVEAGSKHCDQTDQRDSTCPSDEADSSPVQAKRRRLEND
ncbi:transcription intermediary factor 1-beta-like isoform X5 [Hypanus sabinus]|uniref:transcription intermediary factor 1-beta-like isoform X5 n=1 Tax=Hypanus sabinus TaxID=79690 RepID=UPI0028C3F051|nr:transcription intermediary factor 1-beta-like isoform X5 [Hypanus sabinus]